MLQLNPSPHPLLFLQGQRPRRSRDWWGPPSYLETQLTTHLLSAPRRVGKEWAFPLPEPPSLFLVASSTQLSSAGQSSSKESQGLRRKQVHGVNMEREGQFLARRCIFILENWGPWTFTCRFMPNEMQIRVLLF